MIFFGYDANRNAACQPGSHQIKENNVVEWGTLFAGRYPTVPDPKNCNGSVIETNIAHARKPKLSR